MRFPTLSRLVPLSVILCFSPFPAAAADERPARAVRFQTVDVGGEIPEDLRRPEGKSRWHVESVATRTTFVESLAALDDGRSVAWSPGGEILADPSGGEAALRWAFPDRYPQTLRPGALESFPLERRRGERAERIWVETRQVGIGWVHLPAGPREVVLQRVLMHRQDETGQYVPERLLHRWIDPRAGVVAQVSGPAAADGRARLSITEAAVADEVLAGAANLRIYVDELDFPRHERAR